MLMLWAEAVYHLNLYEWFPHSTTDDCQEKENHNDRTVMAEHFEVSLNKQTSWENSHKIWQNYRA